MTEPTELLPPKLLALSEPLDAAALAEQLDTAAGYALAGQLGTPAPQQPLWTPHDTGEAEWAMAHVRACAQQVEAARAQARLWRAQIDAWEEAEVDGANRRGQFFEGALVRYADARLAADPKVRTIKLPSGDVRCTVPQKGTVHVEDEDALICWAEAVGYDDVVKRPPAPAPSALVSELRKRTVAVPGAAGWVALDKDTGEVVPGARAMPPGEPTVKVTPHPTLEG